MTRLSAWLRTPDARWLIAVFALALVVRLVVVANVTPDPRDGRFDDSVFYDSAARHLADGDGYVFDPNVWVTHDGQRVHRDTDVTPTALWPPGWPLTLAAIYAVSGDSLGAARSANVFFGALTVALVYLIALRLFVRREGAPISHAAPRDPHPEMPDRSLLPAIAAGVMLALMPAHVLFTTILLAETFFGFLLTAALAICVYFVFGQPRGENNAPERVRLSGWAYGAWHSRPRLWILCMLGVLVAFAGLTRGEFTVFGGVIALLLLYEYRARAIGPLAALAIGAALALSPWTVRNAITMGEPLVGTTGSGRTMYQGHNPIADGGPSLIPVGQIEAPFAGLPRNEIEVRSNKAASRAAREWAWDHKLKELDLVGRRMWKLFRADEAGVTWLQSNKPWFSPENRDRLITASTAYFWGLAAIVVASAPVWWRGRDARRLVVFAVIPYYMLIFGVLFVGDPRYHYAMYIPMAIFGGAGVAAVARITAAQWRETFGGRTLGAVLRTYGSPER